jgi:hypothetical protein
MSDQEPNVAPASTSSPSSEGGESSSRSRNRRRRGKRRPQGDGAPEPSETSADGTEAAAASDESDGSESGERKKSRRRKKKKRPEGETSGGESNGDQASASGQNAKPQREPREPREPRQRPEKKERAPRGSVLDRRRTRGEATLDFPDDEPIMPAAPAPVATSVDGYIKQLRGWQREVVMTLRGIVKSQANDVTENIMWSQPVYTLDGPICYIKAFRDHVNLGFWRGNELEDLSDRLIGELQTMRHITIRAVNDVDRELFESIVRKAVQLNREKGDPTA